MGDLKIVHMIVNSMPAVLVEKSFSCMEKFQIECQNLRNKIVEESYFLVVPRGLVSRSDTTVWATFKQECKHDRFRSERWKSNKTKMLDLLGHYLFLDHLKLVEFVPPCEGFREASCQHIIDMPSSLRLL